MVLILNWKECIVTEWIILYLDDHRFRDRRFSISKVVCPSVRIFWALDNSECNNFFLWLTWTLSCIIAAAKRRISKKIIIRIKRTYLCFFRILICYSRLFKKYRLGYYSISILTRQGSSKISKSTYVYFL